MANSPNGHTPTLLSKVIDLLIKFTVVVTCIVGVYTLVATIRRDDDQSLDKKRELQQKDTDLFYKQSDMQRAKESVKADFLQKNLALLTSPEPGMMRHAEALIDVTFTEQVDALDVKTKARHIHESATEPPPSSTNGTGQFDYKARGLQYFNAGYFAEAALSFGNAVTLAPKDIQAWNALAYAQLRQGNTNGAFTSISRAIELKPTEAGIVRLVALNATKILCAQGNHDNARAYLNVSIGMNEKLLSSAKSDGELVRMCGFKFN